MAQTLFYNESPLDRIVDVHFGGGIIIAEVPDSLTYLFTLEPDPDPASGGTVTSLYGPSENDYLLGTSIPAADYREKQFFLPTPTEGPDFLRQYYTEYDSGAPPDYVRGPATPFFGTPEGQLEFWEAIVPEARYRFLTAYHDGRLSTPDEEFLQYNGTTLNPQVTTFGLAPAGSDLTSAVYQIIFNAAQDARSYILNMDNIQRASVTQTTGKAPPGYGEGVVLRAYNTDAKIILESFAFTHEQFADEGSFDGTFCHLVVRDGITDEIVEPLWTETIHPTDPPPEEATQIAEFNSDGRL